MNTQRPKNEDPKDYVSTSKRKPYHHRWRHKSNDDIYGSEAIIILHLFDRP